MPEFESRRSTIPPFVPSASGRSASELIVEPDVPDDPPRPQREGLPPGFRMRADPHYVEQLTARVPLPQLRAIPVGEIEHEGSHDLRDLEALVRSVSRFGVLQPLLVRSRAGRFQLIAGAKRLAAASEAGLSDVPCLVYTCDDARARAMAEADNIRAAAPAPAAAPPVPEPPTHTPSLALAELRQTFSTIGSCLHLLGDRDSALRDRVALDLVRTEAHRAERLVQCLTALDAAPVLSMSAHPLRSIVEETLESFAPERRLAGVGVQREYGDGPLLVEADAEWLAVAIAGAFGGLLGMVSAGRTPTLQVRVAAAPQRESVVVEMSQPAVSFAPAAIARLFDPSWTDRPGGYQAALELAAARVIVERHRGVVEAVARERGGFQLSLVLPAIN